MSRIASASAPTSKAFVDVSYRRADRMPEDAVFAGSYRFSVFVDRMVCSLFFRTVDGVDELWAWADWTEADRPEACSRHGAFGIRRKAAAAARPDHPPATRATDLLIAAAEAGNGWIPDIDRGPLLEKARIDQARTRRARALKARQAMPPLILAALDLGLSPEPAGTAVGTWVARCPRTDHTLILSETRWSCPRCRRTGDEADLGALAAQCDAAPAANRVDPAVEIQAAVSRPSMPAD